MRAPGPGGASPGDGRRRRTVGDDAGAGGVAALAIVAATIACALAVVGLGGALTARQRVVAAADAAALAAADTLLGAVAGDPCALAAEVAAAHRVSLESCRLEGAEAVVAVSTRLAGVPVRAHSRAGPTP